MSSQNGSDRLMTAQKFRKRPVVVEAMQWDGSAERSRAVFAWSEGAVFGGMRNFKTPNVLHVKTLEGTMTASPGDWIIKGVAGECYPCKPDVFEKTYEKVEDDKPTLDYRLMLRKLMLFEYDMTGECGLGKDRHDTNHSAVAKFTEAEARELSDINWEAWSSWMARGCEEQFGITGEWNAFTAEWENT